MKYIRKVPRAIKQRGLRWTIGRGFELIGARILGEPTYQSYRWFQYPIYQEAIARTKELNETFLKSPPRVPSTALWLMPDFGHVSHGGPNTILRFAHFLASKGVETTIVIVDATIHRTTNHLAKEVRQFWGFEPKIRFLIGNKSEDLFDDQILPESDICFATLWTTAHYLLPYFKTKAKFYFIQDYETLFYPAGVEAMLADITYDFGYIGIFNTPGLQNAISANHQIEGISFVPGIDKDIFYPGQQDTHIQKSFNVFVYGRPSVPRNMFELVADTIKIAANELKNVQFFVAGWPSYPYKVGKNVKFLGYLPYKKTGDVYRQCHAGIALMATPHPSYIPLQLMACGSVPIAMYNKYTAWLFRNRENCLLSYPNPFNLVERIAELEEDKNLWLYLRQNALDTSNKFDWNRAMEKIWKYICYKSQDY